MNPIRLLIIDNYDSFTYNLYQIVGEILLELDSPFEIHVIKNDELTVQEIKQRNYNRIIISPGPGDSADSSYFGVCAEVITEIGKAIPVFGVCLGMQGICHYYGGKVVRAKLPMHGKTSKLIHNQEGIFERIPLEVEVMRYHSLVAEIKSVPKSLEITAVAIDDNDSQLSWVPRVSNPRSKALEPKTEVFNPSTSSGVLLRNKEFDRSKSFSETLKELEDKNISYEIMGLRHKDYPISGIQFHPESFATEGGKEMLREFLI